MRAFILLLFLSIFIIAIGSIFVLIAVMLGKYELLFLVIVLLIGNIFYSMRKEQSSEFLENIPLVGDCIGILDSLSTFYKTKAPRNVFYYLIFPVTSVLSYFWRNEDTKKELRQYFKLIQWIVLIALVEGIFSSYALYKNFGTEFTLRWLLIEIVFIYFLCNFFTIPLITSSIKLLLKKSYKIICFVLLISFFVIGYSFYYFSFNLKLDSVIFTNIILDRRLENFAEFKENLKDTTTMFLQHQLPKVTNKMEKIDEKQRKEILAKLSEAYKEVLLTICQFGENELFALTMNKKKNDYWGIVFLPTRESLFFAFHYKDKKLNLYERVRDLPNADKFYTFWNQNGYRRSRGKNIARVIIDSSKKAMKVLMVRKRNAGKKVNYSKNENLNSYQESLEKKHVVKFRPLHFYEAYKMNHSKLLLKKKLQKILFLVEKVYFKRHISSENIHVLCHTIQKYWQKNYPFELKKDIQTIYMQFRVYEQKLNKLYNTCLKIHQQILLLEKKKKLRKYKF